MNRASPGSRLNISAAASGGLRRCLEARLEPQDLLERVLPGLLRRYELPQLRLRHELLQRKGRRARVPAVRARHDERRDLDAHELLAACARGHGVVEDRVAAARAGIEIPLHVLARELARELRIDRGGRSPGPDLGIEPEILASRRALDHGREAVRAHEVHVAPEKLVALLHPQVPAHGPVKQQSLAWLGTALGKGERYLCVYGACADGC